MWGEKNKISRMKIKHPSELWTSKENATCNVIS